MLKSLAVKLGRSLPEQLLARVHELNHLKTLLRLQDINCVLDVGANIGQFASELRMIGYTGRIVSFEPTRHVFKQLQTNFRSDTLWSGHCVALGSKSGPAIINVAHNLTVLSSFHPLKTARTDVRPETVEMRRLDELENIVGEHERVFLKMDTQGFDVEVFNGARAILPRVLGLQSEICIDPLYDGMPSYLEALSTYTDAGFALYDMSLVSRAADGCLVEMNCFMRR